MKLKEGMYVRTKDGNIAKIIDNRDNVIVKTDDNTTHLRSMIVNASDNLIDLIEIGDYVNGKRVYNISIVDGLKYLDVEVEDYLSDTPFINADQITSIVTKEQFESVKYEVE